MRRAIVLCTSVAVAMVLPVMTAMAHPDSSKHRYGGWATRASVISNANHGRIYLNGRDRYGLGVHTVSVYDLANTCRGVGRSRIVRHVRQFQHFYCDVQFQEDTGPNPTEFPMVLGARFLWHALPHGGTLTDVDAYECLPRARCPFR